MSTLFDPRDADGVVKRLAMLARARTVPPVTGEGPSTVTWHDLLFDGTRLRDLSRPDQALLRAVAELEAGLGHHLGELPARMRAAWLQRILGIPPRSAEPDVVPLAFTAQPGRTPVVIPRTEVRAKDAAGADRRYRTTEPFTVHGFTVTAVRGYRAVRDDAGRIADHVASWTDPAVPFAPFAALPAPPLAPHRCRFSDQALAVSGRAARTTVTVSFAGDARLVRQARWFHSTATGPRPVASSILRYHSTTAIELTIGSACAPDPASGDPLPWIEMAMPDDAPTLDADQLAAVFGDAGLQVDVTDLPADAAYANDAKADLEKEFQPFGPTPGRGDAFYLRSQEAFGKPLDRLGITLVPPAPPNRPRRIRDHASLMNVALDRLNIDYQRWMDGVPSMSSLRPRQPREGLSDADLDTIAADIGMTATVTWQYLKAGTWQEFRNTGHLVRTLDPQGVTTHGSSFSDESSQGGKTGHAVRALLVGGDLGWSAFQGRVGNFAAAAVTRDPKNPASSDDLIPPVPPSLADVRISYRTPAARPERIAATDGWAWRALPAGAPLVPFRVPVAFAPGSMASDASTLDLSLALPDSALGSTISLHLAVEPADVGADAGTSVWQVATPSGWRAATVSDGTHGLRQSGLLNVVAPPDWQRGAADAGDPGGTSRWLRLASTEPGRLGALVAVVPDVVEAAQVARPALADPGTALAPGDVKGLVGALPAIKKVANLPGRRGRGAEQPADFLRRGSAYFRHRDRAAAAWDYEEHARLVAPEVAAVRCLPHTCPDGDVRPGSLVLVVVPDGTEPMPVPTVALAERIESSLRPRMPLTARLAVVAPAYRPVTVTAHVVLAPGTPGLSGRQAILDGLESFLHPVRRQPVRFGRPLFASEVVAFLESLPVVDRVTTFRLTDGDGTEADPVAVDADRGLAASSGAHDLTVEETL